MVYVPKKLITGRSSFFREGCEAPEYAKHGYVNLTSTSLEMFSAYLHVLHFDEVGIEPGELGITGGARRLVSLYLLAEEVGDAASMNIIMDAIVQVVGWQPDLDSDTHFVNQVYKREIAASHPLKRLLVDFAVQSSSFLELPDDNNIALEHTFILDVARAFAKQRDGEGRKSNVALESKKYHVAVKKT